MIIQQYLSFNKKLLPDIYSNRKLLQGVETTKYIFNTPNFNKITQRNTTIKNFLGKRAILLNKKNIIHNNKSFVFRNIYNISCNNKSFQGKTNKSIQNDNLNGYNNKINNIYVNNPYSSSFENQINSRRSSIRIDNNRKGNLNLCCINENEDIDKTEYMDKIALNNDYKKISIKQRNISYNNSPRKNCIFFNEKLKKIYRVHEKSNESKNNVLNSEQNNSLILPTSSIYSNKFSYKISNIKINYNREHQNKKNRNIIKLLNREKKKDTFSIKSNSVIEDKADFNHSLISILGCNNPNNNNKSNNNIKKFSKMTINLKEKPSYVNIYQILYPKIKGIQ